VPDRLACFMHSNYFAISEIVEIVARQLPARLLRALRPAAW
jgi:hypothetical protein